MANGMIGEQMQQPMEQQPQPPPEQPPPHGEPGANSGHATLTKVGPSKSPPEEDAKIYMTMGLNLISSAETRDAMLGILKRKDPVKALSSALLIIMQKIDASSRQKGIEIDDKVKMFVSHELIKELAKVGETAGIFKLDEDYVELAFSSAIQEYVKFETKMGRINPQKLRAQVMSGINKMPPEEQAEAKAAVQRLQETGKRYYGGGKNGRVTR